MKEFWVEYEFIDTCHGERPNKIRIFKTEIEANEFATTLTDAKVVEVQLVEN